MKEELIEEKIRKYSNMIYRLAFSMLKSKDDSEDIYQDVIIKFFNNIDTFKSEEHEKAWLIRVTINECNSLHRKGWFKNSAELDEEIPYLDKETDEVFYVVAELPVKYRTVIYLFYYEDYKVSEISKILDTNESTIKSQLSRAREMLKQKLKGGFENE